MKHCKVSNPCLHVKSLSLSAADLQSFSSCLGSCLASSRGWTFRPRCTRPTSWRGSRSAAAMTWTSTPTSPPTQSTGKANPQVPDAHYCEHFGMSWFYLLNQLLEFDGSLQTSWPFFLTHGIIGLNYVVFYVLHPHAKKQEIYANLRMIREVFFWQLFSEQFNFDRNHLSEEGGEGSPFLKLLLPRQTVIVKNSFLKVDLSIIHLVLQV